MEGARLIREARERSGLTQEQVAHDAGVSVRTLSGVEAGTVRPQIDTLAKIAGALGKALRPVERAALLDEATWIAPESGR